MYVQHMCEGTHGKYRILWNLSYIWLWVTWCGFQEQNLGLLSEEQVPLITEPSLQLLDRKPYRKTSLSSSWICRMTWWFRLRKSPWNTSWTRKKTPIQEVTRNSKLSWDELLPIVWFRPYFPKDLLWLTVKKLSVLWPNNSPSVMITTGTDFSLFFASHAMLT